MATWKSKSGTGSPGPQHEKADALSGLKITREEGGVLEGRLTKPTKCGTVSAITVTVHPEKLEGSLLNERSDG